MDKQRVALAGLLILGISGLMAGAAHAQTFNLTDLGVINNFSSGSVNAAPSAGVNSSGQVAGVQTFAYSYVTGTGTTVNTSYQGAYDTRANGATLTGLGAGTGINNATSGLPPSSTAFGINNSGIVVGRTYATGTYNDPTYGALSYTNINHAYRLNSNTETAITAANDLGTLGQTVYHNSNNTNSPNSSLANGINASGQIVGSSTGGVNGTVATANPFHAFRINANETSLTAADDLGAMVTGGSSNGMAISSLGQVAGFGSTAVTNQTHAFRMALTSTSISAADDLGTLGTFTFQGTTYSNSFAYGINTSGQVVGTSSISTSTQNHAFRSTPNSAGAVVLTDLGVLGLSQGSGALGIDTLGNTVGYSTFNSGINHAFYYGAAGTTMLDLNNLLASNPNSVVLNVAYGITDNGNIVAYGTQNGAIHGYLLSTVTTSAAAPEASTVSLVLMGLTSGGALLRRRRRGA